MGQGHDKIQFGEVEETTIKKGKREKIFKKIYTVKNNKEDDVCQLPNCSCPSTHTFNQKAKMCSNCFKKGRNFRKHPELPYTEKYQRLPPPKATYSRNNYQELEPVSGNHEVYYHNAWSLPTQKLYIDKIDKLMTQTQVTEQIPQKEVFKAPHYEPAHQYKPIMDYKPPKFQEASIVDNYDYSKVRTDNRMQNLFLYDEK